MNDARPSTGDHSATILFTAFEPSGDDHAHAVIAELRARHPRLRMYAWGGRKMEAAGATLVERTGDAAVMGMPGIAKIQEHRRINRRIARWLDANKVTVHVPVDSPAANFSICAMTKARGITVVHLVAPQIWAWARWRIHKLRRLTDLVLCLLPFEERFFRRRRVPASFIGHFLFDEPMDFAHLDRQIVSMPAGSPRLALLPGSRPDELRRNFPLMLDVFAELQRELPELTGVVAAINPDVEERLRAMAARLGPPRTENHGWPTGLHAVVGRTDAAIRWCDAALVKSGTVTLQVTRQRKPMVVVYRKSNPVTYFLFRAILATKLFTLPNVIAGREIVPEFVPYYGGPGPITRTMLELLRSTERQESQRRDFDSVIAQFNGLSARKLAADAIERAAGLAPINSTSESPASA